MWLWSNFIFDLKGCVFMSLFLDSRFFSIKLTIIDLINANNISKAELESCLLSLRRERVLELTALYYTGMIYMEDDIDKETYLDDKLEEYNYMNIEHLIDKFLGVDSFLDFIKKGWQKVTDDMSFTNEELCK